MLKKLMKNKSILKLKQKIKENLENRIGLTIAIALIIILLLFMTLFFLGVRINFLINDELSIRLEPLDKSILLHYNETTQLNFTIVNDNFMSCKSYCGYKLTDLSKNKIISVTDTAHYSLATDTFIVTSQQ